MILHLAKLTRLTWYPNAPLLNHIIRTRVHKASWIWGWECSYRTVRTSDDVERRKLQMPYTWEGEPRPREINTGHESLGLLWRGAGRHGGAGDGTELTGCIYSRKPRGREGGVAGSRLLESREIWDAIKSEEVSKLQRCGEIVWIPIGGPREQDRCSKLGRQRADREDRASAGKSFSWVLGWMEVEGLLLLLDHGADPPWGCCRWSWG